MEAFLSPLSHSHDGDDDGDPYKRIMGTGNPRDKTFQIILSLALGIVAFLSFCTLRPRWKGLYASRKRQKDEANALPELPDTLFGWILPLWRINDQQILASAGLDAFAFLAFFKMAMKFLIITLFFSAVIIKPVHDANPDENIGDPRKNQTKHEAPEVFSPPRAPGEAFDLETDYLWIYVIFAYLFSGIAMYLIVTDTKKIIAIRQEYLGTRTSVTDRTVRLSGIPPELQDEQKIAEFIESLDIGRVESVTICRNWKELDEALEERMQTLRRLEEAYTIYSSQRRVERNQESLPISQPEPPSPRLHPIADDADEHDGLIGANGHVSSVYDRKRPQTRMWYGFMKCRSKKVDAIDYYEERLRQMDDRVKMLRQKTFAPTPLAFVTLDSVAASQMAIQAVLDPSPRQLIANPSPAPADVVWANTYLPRHNRILRAWLITALIVILTLLWSAILVPIAGLLNLKTIGKVFPGLADVLEEHKNVKSLVNTQLPTIIASLLMVLVPYLYYWLSWYQGMTSQGDVELSAISKNFFFTFFNFFIIFTLLGTGANFYEFFKKFSDAMQDFRKVTYSLALSLQRLLNFYVNFIILQGLGLFPFRLLQAGSVSLYPIFRMGAKTPRDYAELVQPPIFNYGFYLPTALLIFVISMVYSVLRSSWQVLLAGLIYFALGHFVYKYLLLYGMDHQQQSTGRGWGMICDRIFVGLIFFQLTTSGQLLLKQAYGRSALMIPLILTTLWSSILYSRTYKPLMKFIALRSIKRGETYRDAAAPHDDRDPSEERSIDAPGAESAGSSSSSAILGERNVWADTSDASAATPQQHRSHRDTRPLPRHESSTSARAMPPRFVNPSLVAPLDDVWIADPRVRREAQHATVPVADDDREGSV